MALLRLGAGIFERHREGIQQNQLRVAEMNTVLGKIRCRFFAGSQKISMQTIYIYLH